MMENIRVFERKIRELEWNTSQFKSGLEEFERELPLGKKALENNTEFFFSYSNTLFIFGLDKIFKRFIVPFELEEGKEAFKNTLENFAPYLEGKISQMKEELAELKAERDIVKDEQYREEDRQAELVLYQQNAQREVQLGNPSQNAPADQTATHIYPVNEEQQERQKARLERLSQLKGKSESLRQELESDWQQRRTDQDSERENLYKFLFDQNGKS